MSKLKRANCLMCKKPIGRHDADRVSIEVATSRDNNKVYKLAHLKCTQEV